MAEADVVVEAFAVEAFEHVVDGLVGEGGEENALSLLAEAFDDFGDDAGFACSYSPPLVYEKLLCSYSIRHNIPPEKLTRNVCEWYWPRRPKNH